MLGIHGIGRDRADYYLSDLARELPVAGPGRWAGSAAEGLGLTGPVRADEFRRLLESRHPRTGVVLGSGRVSVPAFDLTFSAPKSASVLFALAGADAARAVVAAHNQAVAGSLSYLEQHAITATRRSGARRAVVLPTSGAVAAVFTHGVSRNGDPHVHSHVVLANLVHGADGRWSACDRRGIAAHRLAAAAVYEAHLRAGLGHALGVRWTGGPGRTAEVAGVGPELLGAFSSRGADIRRHMYENAVRTRAAAPASPGPRPVPPRRPAAPFADLEALWRQRADDVGGRLELEPGRAPAGRAVLDEHRFAGVISLPAHGGAHRRDVVAAFGAAARDGATAVGRRTSGRAVGSARVRSEWPSRCSSAGRWSRRTITSAPWAPVRSTPTTTRCGWAPPAPWTPTGTGGASRAPRRRSASRPNLAALPAPRLADHIRTERAVAAARARLGWREPATVDRGLGR